MPEKMCSIPEAGRRLGVSPSTVQRIINSGELLAYLIGKQWKVPESAIDEYLRARSNQPGKEEPK